MLSNLFNNCEGVLISRRSLLKASAILSFAALPELSLAQSTSRTRLLVILLRGGMDGLHAMPPVGDARLEKLRRKTNPDETLKLDGFFALHPSFKNIHAMYQKGEALFVHAASFSYTGRSHFEGQNVMETGLDTPYSSTSGWMGRALDQIGYHSVSATLPVPLILRGKASADTYNPTWLATPQNEVFASLAPLWAAEPKLAMIQSQVASEKPISPSGEVGKPNPLTSLAIEAAKRLKADDGPRMAVLDHVGFDTHAEEPNRSAKVMTEVDDAIGAFREKIGDEAWKNTLIVTVTEFGRTVAENGSMGTDHGWGTAAFLLGGRLKKGGIISDWPGLKKANMFEGRDLPATMDIRNLYAAVLSASIEVDPEQIKKQVLDHQSVDAFSEYL